MGLHRFGQVGGLQLLLAKLGWKTTHVSVPPMADFGLYGPKTAKAWAQSATKRKLNPTFQRASSTTVYVHPKTVQALARVAKMAAPTAVTGPKLAPAIAKPKPAPKPAPAPAPAPAVQLYTRGVTGLHNILYTL